MSTGMAPLEPAVSKSLHAVQSLFLVFPKTARVFSKRGRNCGSRQKHPLHGAPLFSQIRIFHSFLPSSCLIPLTAWAKNLWGPTGLIPTEGVRIAGDATGHVATNLKLEHGFHTTKKGASFRGAAYSDSAQH